MSAASSLLDYLPPVFSEDPFLGRFLLAFESILLKRLADEEAQPGKGLEETIAGIHNYFDAQNTPEEFLEWLSNWVVFSLRADWKPEQKRDFLAQAINLYGKRGTKEYLEQVIRIYSKSTPEIIETPDALFMVGRAKVGADTWISDAKPYHFTLKVTIPETTLTEIVRQEEIVRALAEAHKPAHATYELDLYYATMSIGVRCAVGEDTWLGQPVPTTTDRRIAT